MSLAGLRAALLCALIGLLAAPSVLGQGSATVREPLEFSSPEQQERFYRLAEELRCLVCQNQSLADSDAPLAHDLRQEVFNMLESGASDEQIKSFLVERYGDFVLYRPPMQSNTLILWVGPILLLVAGAAVIGFNVRRRRSLLEEENSEERLA
jgi:cytochrome c-type biogenesis protein CcmH